MRTIGGDLHHLKSMLEESGCEEWIGGEEDYRQKD
jgi:hypothetical protein